MLYMGGLHRYMYCYLYSFDGVCSIDLLFVLIHSKCLLGGFLAHLVCIKIFWCDSDEFTQKHCLIILLCGRTSKRTYYFFVMDVYLSWR